METSEAAPSPQPQKQQIKEEKASVRSRRLETITTEGWVLVFAWLEVPSSCCCQATLPFLYPFPSSPQAVSKHHVFPMIL